MPGIFMGCSELQVHKAGDLTVVCEPIVSQPCGIAQSVTGVLLLLLFFYAHASALMCPTVNGTSSCCVVTLLNIVFPLRRGICIELRGWTIEHGMLI
jgi:hypothetical protein